MEQLSQAMRLGKLGEQIVLKSQYAFSKLEYQGWDIVRKDDYFLKRKSRNNDADQRYMKLLEEETDGLYIQDIMRGGIQNDDPRIPRNIS